MKAETAEVSYASEGPAFVRGTDTLRRIFSYVAEFKGRIALVLCCMLLSTAASLAGSYVLRPVINRIADAAVPAAERLAYLGMMLGVMAILCLPALRKGELKRWQGILLLCIYAAFTIYQFVS